MGLVRLYRQVRDKDLFAVEAKHHPSCLTYSRTAFANYERGIHRAEGPQDSEQIRFSAAHEKAFVLVVDHVQAHVVQQNEVQQLSSLRLLYVEELRRHGYENTNYRSEKLLNRLQKNPIKDHLRFTKVDRDKGGAVSFWLVYSSNITVADCSCTSLHSRKCRSIPRRRISSTRPYSTSIQRVQEHPLAAYSQRHGAQCRKTSTSRPCPLPQHRHGRQGGRGDK